MSNDKLSFTIAPEGFHSGNQVGFGWLSFDSVIFRMRVATGHTRVGSANHGSVEDQLFELSGYHQFGVG